MIKKVGIVNATPFYQDANGDCYLQPPEYKSLEMYFFLGDITLFKPRVYLDEMPAGWVKVASEIKCEETCNAAEFSLKRKAAVQKKIKATVNEIDLYYFRMPSYESSWAWETIKNFNKLMFTEVHGDWPQSIRNEDKNSLVRRLTRGVRANSAKKVVTNMLSNSLFVITIGTKMQKYILDKSKPTLATTNHLLNESDYVSPDKITKSSKPFDILFVGDIQLRKGMLYLFEAFKLLVEQGEDVRLNIVGSGQSEATLKDFVQQNKLEDKVIFHGRIPHGPFLFEHFKQANVFVLPSVAAETLPRVTHEAMALSCPVIATDIGDVASQVENDCGILVQPRDVDSITVAIKRLMNDSELYSKLQTNAYNRSLGLTYEKQKSEIESYVQSVLNG
jgi:glycosyltransferase involved in cell wall biosynthesis